MKRDRRARRPSSTSNRPSSRRRTTIPSAESFGSGIGAGSIPSGSSLIGDTPLFLLKT